MKKLRLSQSEQESLYPVFQEWLKTAKIQNNKVVWEHNIIPTAAENTKKARVLFKKKAWEKMRALVKDFSSEVAWHGTVERTGDFNFEITDIVVYPQTVTGVTVNTDQEAYEMWLIKQPDEVFNKLRFQGHSHVNMGVTPSSTDEENMRKLVSQLGEDDFYIFIIINKSHNVNTRIYDMKNNLLFETLDIQVDYEPNELDDFIAEAKELVKTKTTAYSPTGYRSPYGIGNYGGYNYGVNTYSSPKTETKTETKKDTAPTVVQQKLDDKKDDDKDIYSDKWWNHYYGYYDDMPDDEADYLPGYPNYNAAVNSSKKDKKKKKHR